MNDPFVEEIRKNRMKHTKQFNFDIHDICNDLRKFEKLMYIHSDIDKNNKFINKTSCANYSSVPVHK